MLTPMMVQYLVGLCCLRHDPDAVEITLGDMVYDHVAEKDRDVDITITFKDGNEITAFKAAEVKKESQPLDVNHRTALFKIHRYAPNNSSVNFFNIRIYRSGKEKSKTLLCRIIYIKTLATADGRKFSRFQRSWYSVRIFEPC